MLFTRVYTAPGESKHMALTFTETIQALPPSMLSLLALATYFDTPNPTEENPDNIGNLFPEFLDTLINSYPDCDPSQDVALNLAQAIWAMVTTEADDLPTLRKQVADAFVASEGPDELVAAWHAILLDKANKG
jgi:hypothetical protein